MNKKEDFTLDLDVLDKVANRLSIEKKRLERQSRQEFRNARKYVRTHPKEGLLYAFAGGLFAGIILTKLFSK